MNTTATLAKGGRWERYSKLFQGMDEVFFATNIASALGYGLSLFLCRSAVVEPSQNDSLYYFLRGAVRVSKLVGRAATTPVTTDAVARQYSIVWNQTVIAITFVGSVCAAASVLLVLVRAFDLRATRPLLFRWLAGIVALFVAPASYLLVGFISRRWPSGAFEPTLSSPGRSVLIGLITIFLFELITVVLVTALSFRHRISTWISSAFLIIHFLLWGVFLFGCLPRYMYHAPALYLVHAVLWFIPAFGSAAIASLTAEHQMSTVSKAHRYVGGWTVLTGIGGITVLLVIWLPTWHHALQTPSDPASAMIQVSRGPCYGACPAYTVTLHADGTVQYKGKTHVRVSGVKTSKIDPKVFVRALQILNSAQFSSLEDRAFSWCFDTPSIAVSVSIDGTYKRVSSDSNCAGAPNGLQAQFVRAGFAIDSLVGSDQWVLCDGRACR